MRRGISVYWVNVELYLYFVNIYRPQTKFAKVKFLHLSVSHSVHVGVSASVHAGIHPSGQTPPQVDTPHGSRHLPCAVHAGRYGQQARMHSCFIYFERLQYTLTVGYHPLFIRNYSLGLNISAQLFSLHTV